MTPEEARNHWIALVHVHPREAEARDVVPLGAYAYAVAKAESESEFRDKIERAASDLGFSASELEEVELVDDRWRAGRLGSALYDLAKRSVDEGVAAFGTFHSYASEEESDDG